VKKLGKIPGWLAIFVLLGFIGMFIGLMLKPVPKGAEEHIGVIVDAMKVSLAMLILHHAKQGKGDTNDVKDVEN